jgi:MoxR-like ATPase
MLLADEINSTPPKTQASLLEAMEERQVSVDAYLPPAAGHRFIVAATQNPVEYEGTYPLPEAQLDRFLLKLTMPLPDRRDEIEVIRRHAAGFDPRDLAAAGIRAVAGAADLERARQAVAAVAVEPEISATSWTWCGPPVRPRRSNSAFRPRRHGAAEHVPGLGLAVRTELCHPG